MENTQSYSNTTPSHENTAHKEGKLTKQIEQQTAKLPSDLFLFSAVASIALSAALHFSGKKDESVFVGHWAPTLLILGLYNKIVKVAGSEKKEARFSN